MVHFNTRQHDAVPTAVLGGGERSVIAFTVALLSFFNMKRATVLRAVSSELRDAITAFPWDENTHVPAHIVQWRASFPNAKAANLNHTIMPAEAFEHLQGLTMLNLVRSRFTEAALFACDYPLLTTLDIKSCFFFTAPCLPRLICQVVMASRISA
jgi:hypothetical protein